MSVNGENEIVDVSVRNNFPTADRKSCGHVKFSRWDVLQIGG